MKTRLPALAVLALLAISCQAAPTTPRSFDAPPEKVLEAVRNVLGKGGVVDRSHGTFTTGWQSDERARRSWSYFGQPLYGQTRYKVRVDGSRVEVETVSRVFISFGPHARRWTLVGHPAESGFIARVQEALVR